MPTAAPLPPARLAPLVVPFIAPFIALLGALLVFAAAPAAAQTKGKVMAGLVNKPFSATREKLLADGWAPVETNLTTARGAPERERGEAGKFLTAGYNEIERCTGGKRNYCFLNYKRGNTCLRVRTLGTLDLPASDPKVHGAGDACPSKQKARR
ncbi:MAG: hypothetical protein IT499_09695 [Rubrivivax sp.]|nr:hypothetical protein [Rubrivivax sp.]